MIKRLFAWKLSGVFIPVFYGLGVICWRFGLHSTHYRWMFLVAAVCIAAGFFSSLQWVWCNSFFRTNPETYARVQAERRARGLQPRKGKKNLRRSTTVGFAAVFLFAFLLLARSYEGIGHQKLRSRVDVYLSDGVETRAARAPLMDRTFHSRGLVFAMANVPSKDLNIQAAEASTTIDVILRNMSGIDLRNAQVEISSNVAIAPGDGSETVISQNDLSATVGSLSSYSRTSEQRILKVNVSIPHPHTNAGLYVTLSGGNVQPSAAVENLHFVDTEDTFPGAKLRNVANR